MIRHVGCELPIQVWYLGDWGEFDPRMAQALERFDVGWINGQAFARDHGLPRRILGGWEMKAFAAAHCPFREVISLDADSYPAYNPEEFLAHPEYQRVGAAFWPDQGKLEPGQWERFGLPLPRRARLGIRVSSSSTRVATGNRSRSRAGSTTTATTSITTSTVTRTRSTSPGESCGHEVCVPTSVPGWNTVAFVQMDFDGQPALHPPHAR